MNKIDKTISSAEIDVQLKYISKIREINNNFTALNGRPAYAVCITFGCQQNEADTERIKGILVSAGYEMTEDTGKADIIVLNTCAVREHAEQRVFGTVGEYSHLKKDNPGLIVAVCGCMVQQEHIKEKIKKSYPFVDMMFGTHTLWRFAELLYRRLTGKKRIADISGDAAGTVCEGMPVCRKSGTKAWLSIMYGCNNFCTYCIVPYVRGRERSRSFSAIEKEFKELLSAGYKDITLLGQNVNSYGKDLPDGISFPELLKRLAEIPGEFVLRFMTSHPKDASDELFKVMSENPKIARHIHLPVQSGSDRILKQMNRCYTSGEYLRLIEKAREVMPDIVFTSDIIVGFPNETEEDFSATMELVERVRFASLFIFIYSKREGTPAAKIEDFTPDKEKHDRFDRLLALQNRISEEENEKLLGKTADVLIEEKSRDNAEYPLTAKTGGGRLIYLKGDCDMIGRFVRVKILKCSPRALFGEVCMNG